MSVPWLKNLLGFALTDQEQNQIPYPRLEVTIHVTCKAIQAFVVLGACLIAPISVVLSSDTIGLVEIASRMTSYGRTAIMIALFVGPLVTYLRLMSAKKEEEVTDRCYRLRKNRVQLRVDRGTLVGVLAGYSLASLGLLPSIMFGITIGIPAGILGAVIYNSMHQ